MTEADHPLDLDELSGLADEAAELGIEMGPPPHVRRIAVQTDDGEVSALAWGDTAPELVLLHGVGLNAHTWDAFSLALGRPVVAIDLPGHGRSAWRADGCYDPASIAPAVAAAMAELAPDPCTVIGHSLGGLAAIAIADARPELVPALVLVDAAPAGTARVVAGQVVSFLEAPDSFASRLEIVDRARRFGFGFSRAAVERAVVLNTVVRPDGRVVWRHHVGQDPGAISRLGDSSVLWPAFGRYQGALTVIRAAQGFITDIQMDEVAARRPATSVVEVDSGHNVQEDDPVGLARLVASIGV